MSPLRLVVLLTVIACERAPAVVAPVASPSIAPSSVAPSASSTSDDGGAPAVVVANVADAGAPTPRVRTPPPGPAAPRGPVTWEDVADSDRSTVACRVDKECIVETETPPCVCCSHPRVFAIHAREKKRGPSPPQPPCTPACATDDLPCRAPPAGPASDVFRARCVDARCQLERK